MARPVIRPSRVPTPGPWLVHGEAEAGAPASVAIFGIEPAADDQPGGFHYFIRQDRAFEPGVVPLHIATGIQRLADAQLMAAAPDLAATLLALLISPNVTTDELEPQTRQAVTLGWSLLVAVAPHLEL